MYAFCCNCLALSSKENRILQEDYVVRRKWSHGLQSKCNVFHSTIPRTSAESANDIQWRRKKTLSAQPFLIFLMVINCSMSNIDFTRMEYSVQLTFRQFWRDPRLAYEKMYYGQKVPKFLIITQKDLIWTPDTFFMNEKQAHRHAIDKLNLMIRIHSDGTVMYSERLSLTLSCAMYLQRYPMDVQTCALLLASYAFTTDDIVYQWKQDIPIELHPMLNTSLPNFSLDPPETTICTSRTTTGEYSCLQTVFRLKRMFRSVCRAYMAFM
ncbi:Neurotransmitter-gated ion-channel ligand binding domain protein [Ancylostoma caninum]|uniref:Neurotransmitter-gated ion-channel ligand binding domain protein n=1 Tax=Ancylostoma caninum TaxID=29170 RepID=A0A368GI45_ANCCA|nr:Neurotransmitter-gated ion-channel ligand binding domain protein [Ancylostoma caninum]